MGHPPPDDYDAEFVMEFRTSARIDLSDATDCISHIVADIIRRVQTDKGDIDINVGDVSACRIYGNRAENEGYNLWDACDAHSQEAADGYSLILDEKGDFRPEVQEQFPDAFSPEILVIGDVHVDPAFRGRGLGLVAVRRLIDLFEPDGGLVVIHPFPMQFGAAQKDDPVLSPELAMFTDTEPESIARLQRYWSRLGFDPIPNSEWFGLSPAVRTPTSRDLSEEMDRER